MAASPPDLGLPERYQVLGRLGAGGFGQVLLAEDRELGRRVAVKLLNGCVADAEGVARFRQEALLTSRITHPHVVVVFDFGVTPAGSPYIVYEYVEGRDLLAARADIAPQPRARVARWGAELAAALAAIHAHGVLHRDVKPANVLIRTSGEAVLCDLGVARGSGEGAVPTATGMLLGTPATMAPELFRGQPPSPASDQFGLGASLYELLHGEPVYGTRELGDILGRLSGRDPVPVGVRPGAPDALDRILARTLALAPAQRFPDMEALGAALQEVAARQAATPEPPPAAAPHPGATRVLERSMQAAAQATPRGSRGRAGRPGALAPWLVLLGLVGGVVWGIRSDRAQAPALPRVPPPEAGPATEGWRPQAAIHQARLRERLPFLDHRKEFLELPRTPEGDLWVEHVRRERARVFSEQTRDSWSRTLADLADLADTLDEARRAGVEEEQLEDFLRSAGADALAGALYHQVEDLRLTIKNPAAATIEEGIERSAALVGTAFRRFVDLKDDIHMVVERLRAHGPGVLPGLAWLEQGMVLLSDSIDPLPTLEREEPRLDQLEGEAAARAVRMCAQLGIAALERHVLDCPTASGRLRGLLERLAARLPTLSPPMPPEDIVYSLVDLDRKLLGVCSAPGPAEAAPVWLGTLEAALTRRREVYLRAADVAEVLRGFRRELVLVRPETSPELLARLVEVTQAVERPPGVTPPGSARR